MPGRPRNNRRPLGKAGGNSTSKGNLVGEPRPSRPSLIRRRSVINTSRDEGILYTVKVAEHPLNSSQVHLPPSQSEEPKTPQYTIGKKAQIGRRNYLNRLFYSFGIDFMRDENVDSYLYRPTKPLAFYINWTFYASFSAVFLSFLAFFIVLCLGFAALFALAGHYKPDCIVVSGDQYGANPDSKFGDAFAMSWTTFTTVGYGNVYTATGNDLDVSHTGCAGVVFLSTLESFLGLIYAGMCAAILFGKVNRVQSHAHLTFANAVCLQYADVDLDELVDEQGDSDYDDQSDDDGDNDENGSKHPFVNFDIPSADETTNEANPKVKPGEAQKVKHLLFSIRALVFFLRGK